LESDIDIFDINLSSRGLTDGYRTGRTIRAIAAHGSFVETSRRLRLTQSTISARMQRLETGDTAGMNIRFGQPGDTDSTGNVHVRASTLSSALRLFRSVNHGLACGYDVPGKVLMIRGLRNGALQGITGTVNSHRAFRDVE